MENQELTDEQLMEAIAGKDRYALAELVRRHQDKAIALAYRTLGRWELAEDVSQDAFLRVYHAAPRYKPEAKFSTWFYRIVVNLCLDEKRREKKTRAGTDTIFDQVMSSSASNPEIIERNQETKQAVWKALGRLNERERMAVVLHRFEGFSHLQIAELTQWSPSAVESLIVRGYQKLRKLLSEYRENP
jgi:RNA polymerase sigma-70 factor, ECF subfamily